MRMVEGFFLWHYDNFKTSLIFPSARLFSVGRVEGDFLWPYDNFKTFLICPLVRLIFYWESGGGF